MKRESDEDRNAGRVGGLAGWLLARLRARLRSGHGKPPRLAVIERIALGPRQSLALVEAEGRRLLVATSSEGTPAFYPLDEPVRRAAPGQPFQTGSVQLGVASRMPGPGSARSAARPGARPAADRDARVSW